MDTFEWISDKVKQLSFELFLSTWKKSFILEGRADRKEFWNFQILMGSISITSLFITHILGLDALFFLLVLCMMASVIPSYSLAVRRCHDLNLSDILALSVAASTFIPGIGQLIYFVAIGGIPTQANKESLKKD